MISSIETDMAQYMDVNDPPGVAKKEIVVSREISVTVTP